MKHFLIAVTYAFLLISNSFSYQGEYRIGLYQDTQLNYDQIVHIIVIGSAVKEDSDQFFQSGLSRAIRYKEFYPQDLVVLISSPEVVDRDDDKVFSDFKINVIKKVDSTLYQEVLVKELKEFKRIQSIDFFGHSSPWGFKLGKKDSALDPSSIAKQLSELKGNFLKDAYITINSCNSGFNIAPKLSELLEIPVSGTLTSGLFERIESDNHWYKENDWNKNNYVESNKVSYEQEYDCELTGACFRMKAAASSYSSYWGTFDQGLSFSKFFCNFENIAGKCERGMAASILTFPSSLNFKRSSSFQDFETIVFDWICQTSKDRTVFKRCVDGIQAAVARGDLIFKTHKGPELKCDFKSCNAKVVCKNKKIFGSGPKSNSCKLEAVVDENPKNAANEYLYFMKGFKSLSL